jgi:hypothetical protein
MYAQRVIPPSAIGTFPNAIEVDDGLVPPRRLITLREAIVVQGL